MSRNETIKKNKLFRREEHVIERDKKLLQKRRTEDCDIEQNDQLIEVEDKEIREASRDKDRELMNCEEMRKKKGK